MEVTLEAIIAIVSLVSRSPVRVWTFVGYQMDLMQNQPAMFPLRQTRESRGHDFGQLRGVNS
ncbi:hypothetical protein CSPAE12_04793 [Colletotrichum incanum]|nr:hypothetical protein CSPAE12_04793 [Colletotrichum incanum]